MPSQDYEACAAHHHLLASVECVAEVVWTALALNHHAGAMCTVRALTARTLRAHAHFHCLSGVV